MFKNRIKFLPRMHFIYPYLRSSAVTLTVQYTSPDLVLELDRCALTLELSADGARAVRGPR